MYVYSTGWYDRRVVRAVVQARNGHSPEYVFTQSPHGLSLPGGGVEAGETRTETALREVAEELDIRVSDLTVLAKLERLLEFDTMRNGHPTHIWAAAIVLQLLDPYQELRAGQSDDPHIAIAKLPGLEGYRALSRLPEQRELLRAGLNVVGDYGISTPALLSSRP